MIFEGVVNIIYLYFKTLQYDYYAEWCKLLHEEYSLGLNKEVWDKNDYNYIADIWINSPKDLWRVREILGRDFSLFIDEDGFESILI